mgnify:CR=1 FL=1
MGGLHIHLESSWLGRVPLRELVLGEVIREFWMTSNLFMRPPNARRAHATCLSQAIEWQSHLLDQNQHRLGS